MPAPSAFSGVIDAIDAAVGSAAACWRADVAPHLPTTSLGWAAFGLGAVGLVSILTAVLPWILSLFFFRQSLKKRYNASWALVTGGSSGIGLAIVRKLATQGLNVVIVAMPDPLLASSLASLRASFPDVEFRSVGVQLGSGDYLEKVAEATAGVPVTIVINNAGYMKTGLFEANEWRVHLDNINCNATAAVALSHLFVRRMRAAGLRGCVTFTSSPAGFMPSPFSVLYGATKSMLTHFATSLAAEVRLDGIDVLVLHPSPVQTNFYTGAHAMPTLQFFQSTGGTAEHVADVLLRSVGRCVIVDQGYYSVALRLLLRIIDFSFLSEVIALSAHRTGDYTVLKAALANGGGTGSSPAAPTPSAASKRRNSVARK